MKILKILIIMVFLLVSIVSAYEVNDTIRINAEYKEDGTFKNITDANISIYLPNGITDIDNDNMNNTDIGKWFYDYLIPNYEGEYDVLIVFYNNSVYKGNDTETFDVGDVNILKWNTCPTGTQGWVTLWIIILILITLGIVGISAKNQGLLTLSGIFMLFMTFMTYPCGMILGLFTVFAGITFLIIAASVKT